MHSKISAILNASTLENHEISALVQFLRSLTIKQQHQWLHSSREWLCSTLEPLMTTVLTDWLLQITTSTRNLAQV